MPLIPLDDHESILQVPSLEFENGNRYRRKDYIGIPNGTGKWQVGNDNQQNSSYKKNMTKEKSILLTNTT